MPSWQCKLVRNIVRLGFLPARYQTNIDIRRSRKRFERFCRMAKVPADILIEAVSFEGLTAEWVTTDKHQERVVLYLHGGGYCIGSSSSYRPFVAQLAKALKANILSINYRLAPEHRFPAALEDALIAYRWLLKTTHPKKIIVAGDSAGGGLVLATLLAARDAGDPMPLAAICFSPWTDLALTGESMQTKAKIDPVLAYKPTLAASKLYLNDVDPKTPLASPLYGDLKGLPPLLIQVGTDEVLLSDSTRFAEKVKAAGVDVTLDVWENMIHVWPIFFTSFVPEARQALAKVAEFVEAKDFS